MHPLLSRLENLPIKAGTFSMSCKFVGASEK